MKTMPSARDTGKIESIFNITDLPSPPILVQRLMALVTSESSVTSEIAQVIEMDSAMTARVLRIVNSPFYGMPRKIKSVDESVTILGLNSVRHLIVSASMYSTLKIPGSETILKDLWTHSFAVGYLAKNLMAGSEDAKNDTFIAGILHDIGRLIFLKNAPEKYRFLYKGEQRAVSRTDEKYSFGMDHQQIGGELALKWNFPLPIAEPISHHHSPSNALPAYCVIAAAIHVADIIVHGLGVGNSGNNYVNEYDPKAWNILKTSPEQIKEIIKASLININRARESFSEI